MKTLSLLCLLLASSALRAEDNYIDSGARQEHGGTKPVVLSATNVGTTAAGNALLLPSVAATFATPTYTGTLTSSAVTAGGTVAAGARFALFMLSSDFVGNINGVAYSGSTVLSVSLPPVPGALYPAIIYTRSAGTLTITTFQ